MYLSRRNFLRSTGLALSTGVAAASEVGDIPTSHRKRPNVVFILTDQHNVRGLGCYGGPDVETPVLDGLAGDGVRFDRAYCQVPVCVPNRSGIFTGRYPQTLGTYTNSCPPSLAEPMLPWYLAHAGYVTGGFGKTHFSHNEERGFMETDITFQNYNAFLATRGIESAFPNPPTPDEWPFCGYVGDSPIPAELSFANWVTHNGIEFLRKHTEEPFFLYLGYYGPHPPYQAPKPYADRYDARTLTLPPRYTQAQQEKRPKLMRGFQHLTESQLRATLRQYYGLCTHIDENIGRLLTELDALGLEEDTLVVFSTDHGNHLGSYNRIGKTWTLHDSCLRVPLLMRWPGHIPAGHVVNGMVQSIDILPTILELAGLDAPDTVQGESRAAEARGQCEGGRDAVFAGTWNNVDPADRSKTAWGQQCIRTRTHKLITWTTGERELYDLLKDPWEYDNIADTPEAAPVQARLQQELLTWWLQVQDRTVSHGKFPTADRDAIEEHLAFGRRVKGG